MAKMTPKQWEGSKKDAQLDAKQRKQGIKEGSAKDKAIDKKYIKAPKKK